MGTRLIHKNQRGFSLIELLIVIALAALVTAGITTTVFQVFNMNSRTANRMAAVSQVQNAGKLVSEDILEAQSDKIVVNSPDGEFLILGWTAQNGTAYAVNYTLESMPSGEFKILWRKHYTDSVLDSTTKVAEYIDPVQTSCVPVDDALKFQVTATVGDESETRVYEVEPRPESL